MIDGRGLALAHFCRGIELVVQKGHFRYWHLTEMCNLQSVCFPQPKPDVHGLVAK
jgi:hypothetical protein